MHPGLVQRERATGDVLLRGRKEAHPCKDCRRAGQAVISLARGKAATDTCLSRVGKGFL